MKKNLQKIIIYTILIVYLYRNIKIKAFTSGHFKLNIVL